MGPNDGGHRLIEKFLRRYHWSMAIRTSWSLVRCFGVMLGISVLIPYWAVDAASNPSPNAGESADPPHVQAVWGELVHGSAIRLTGAAFGAHTLEIASGLGSKGWIEASRDRTPFNRLKGVKAWTTGQATPIPASISTERAHSGSKSVLARVVRSTGAWQSVMLYTHPTSYDEIWISFWFWFDPIHTSVPIGYSANKWFRIGDATVNNTCGEIYTGARWTDDAPGAATVLIFCANEGNQWAWRRCYENIFDNEVGAPLCTSSSCGLSGPNIGDPVGESSAENFPSPREWTRVVIRAKSSDLDVANGEFFFSVHKPNQVEEVSVDWSGILTHSTDCTRDAAQPWRHFQFQNYFDDNVGSDMEQRADFFYDDLYLQFGTQARVEIGDRPTYDLCTHLETQVPTAWSDDEITVELNRGSFSAGDEVFVFVVRADGSRSRGLPVSLQ
jgi:hypothetical protein